MVHYSLDTCSWEHIWYKGYTDLEKWRQEKIMGIEEQKKLTKNIGWGEALKKAHTDVVEKYKTKAQNIWGGVKVVAKKLKGKE